MTTAVITFSEPGFKVMQQLAAGMAVDQYLHRACYQSGHAAFGITPFERVYALTAEIFQRYRQLVYIAPCGVAVRAIAPLIRHKLKDPAVVCVDVGARHAVSLLSGHEGGANDLAIAVGNLTGAEPVISTSSEAIKDLIVGIGCRRGKTAEQLIAAIRAALSLAGVELERVRYLATADVKGKEPGLLQAAAQLQIPLRIIDSELIRNSTLPFGHSEWVATQVQLPAVSEPAALLSGRRTTLILQKTAGNGITIAIARENCTSLA